MKQFVLDLTLDSNGSVLELNGHPVACVVPPPRSNGVADDEPWTDEKNERRCDLIDRKFAGGLSPAEHIELAELQEQMVRYRRKVAPLPLEAARKLHQELLAKAVAAQKPAK